MKMNKYLLAILLSLLFASSAVAALKLNETAPTFSLRDLQGKDFYLGDYAGAKKIERGNGVILSFFASWCTGCRNELPLVNSLVAELTGKGIKVVIVDVKEDADTIGAFLAELKVEKPVVLMDRYGTVGDEYQVRFLPTTFFIGAEGQVKDIIFGEIKDKDELMASAGKLLK
jgi:thiol-disulfide isomerase/thioredoxin